MINFRFIPVAIILFLVVSCARQDYHVSQVQEKLIPLETERGINLFSGYPVIVFYFPDCPLSENYTLVINQLAREYEKQGFSFYGVIPGEFYSTEEIQAFAGKYNIEIPLFLDPQAALVRFLNATITPEVFLLNDQAEILYSGAIDNWAYDLGRKRRVITEHYLKDALRAVVNGEEIKIKKTEAIGCFIEVSS